MATLQGIAQFLETLDMMGYLTERKGAPNLQASGARTKLATVWHALLVDVTDEQLSAALASYLRDPEGQWYPQPGLILAHVPGRKAASIDNSDELWGSVMMAIRSIGYYGSPQWTGPDAEAIQAGIQALGGWQHLCSTLTEDQVPAHRASFRQVVRTIQQRKALQTETDTVSRITGPNLTQLEDPDAEF